MSDQINVKLPIELKLKLEQQKIDPYLTARRAWEQAVGQNEDIASMMKEEEDRFGAWADSFIRLYQFVNKRLEDRESLITSEVAKLEQVWKRIQERMKTREQLMEEVPELKELTYEDIFDWSKAFAIIDKYPRTLKGRIGYVQIREAVLYREVKAGRFTGIQEARDKLRAEIELRVQKVKEELQAWTQSEEHKKQWLIKQEELAIERMKKEGEQVRDVAKAVYDHTVSCPDEKTEATT